MTDRFSAASVSPRDYYEVEGPDGSRILSDGSPRRIFLKPVMARKDALSTTNFALTNYNNKKVLLINYFCNIFQSFIRNKGYSKSIKSDVPRVTHEVKIRKSPVL